MIQVGPSEVKNLTDVEFLELGISEIGVRSRSRRAAEEAVAGTLSCPLYN